MKKELSFEKFIELAKKGFTCKQIAKEMGIHYHSFGFKMKEILGMYPSVYIARIINGKTTKRIS